MIILLIILLGFGLILFAVTYISRKNKEEEVKVVEVDEECCGAHEVCERDSLLNSHNKIVYFDDEELDVLAGIDASTFTDEQANLISEVFYTLKENEVAEWLRSLQLRHIDLPQEIKDSALLIVSERRK